MNEQTELKPCPFCGEEVSIVAYEPRLHRPIKNHKYAIECCECDMLFGFDIDYGGRFDTKKEATEAWNRRAGNV